MTVRRGSLVVLMIVLLAAAVAGGAEAPQPRKFLRAGANRIAGEYIVILRDDIPAERIPTLAAKLGHEHRGRLARVWAEALRGFVVAMAERDALAMSRDPRVKFVEENAYVETSGTQQTYIDPATCNTGCTGVPDNRLWHLDRADQNYVAPNNTYSYCTTGDDITVYVVDTGVWANHSEFGPNNSTRVLAGYNSTGDLMPANDPCIGPAEAPAEEAHSIDHGLHAAQCLTNGHGTAVASLVGGRYSGIAKDVTIVPIKTARCDYYSARQRKNNHPYALHETAWVEVDTGGNTFKTLYRVQSAGTTASSAGTGWPLEGASVDTRVDGTVTWKVVPRTQWENRQSVATIAAGLGWILSPANPGPKSRAVVTLSTFTLPAESAGLIEAKIDELLDAGLTVIASANNQNSDACYTVPANMSRNNPTESARNKVITVGGTMIVNRPWSVPAADEADGSATDQGGPVGLEPPYDLNQPVRERRWICGEGDSGRCTNYTDNRDLSRSPSDPLFRDQQAGSNGGPCVTVFAPAKNLSVASIASETDYRDPRKKRTQASGTSWSAPIVAGFVARLLEGYPSISTPDEVHAKLMENAPALLDPEKLDPRNHLGNAIAGTPHNVVRITDIGIHTQPTPPASGPMVLTVGATGTSQLLYQWYVVNDGFDLSKTRDAASSTAIPGATSTSYSPPTEQSPKGYWVRVTNNCGSADSNIAVVSPVNVTAPTNVVATAAANIVSITWTAGTGASNYDIEYKIDGGNWQLAETVDHQTLSRTHHPGTVPGGVVLYRVVAKAANSSAASTADFANVISYEPISPSQTLIRAAHITELRAATNLTAQLLGLSSFPSFSAAELNPAELLDNEFSHGHLTTLLSRINTIRNAAARPSAAFSAATPASMVQTLGSHVSDLRAALE